MRALLALVLAVVPTHAPVTALDASGGRIAYATAWTATKCERVVAGTWSYAPRVCPAVSTGRGVAAVEVAGKRTLWLSYVGGNTREWSLATATTTSPKPRVLRFVPQDVDLPAPIVLGSGDGSIVPYAVGRTVVALLPSGARAYAWTAPATVTALSARGADAVAVGADGSVRVIRGGREISSTQFEQTPAAAFSTSRGLLAQVGRTIRLGSSSWQLPAGAQLQDANAAGLAAYVASGRIHVLDTRTGTDRVVASGSHARLDGDRLVVANGARVSILRALRRVGEIVAVPRGRAGRRAAASSVAPGPPARALPASLHHDAHRTRATSTIPPTLLAVSQPECADAREAGVATTPPPRP